MTENRGEADPSRPGARGHGVSGASRGLLLVGVWMLTALLPSCNAGERTLVEVDPGAAPLSPTYEMVEAILDRSCVPCHRGGGDDDDDSEAEDPDFDSCRGILAGTSPDKDATGRSPADRFIQEVFTRETMPPGAWPRLSEREKLILTRWLGNGRCAPCNPCP